MLKSVCMLSALALLGACSHQQPKKVSKPHHVSKSFFDVLKTPQNVRPQGDQRFPASAKPIQGAKAFMAALKSHPEFFKVPVGQEIVKEYYNVYEGETYKDQDHLIYLKQHSHGYFVLELDKESPAAFTLYESWGLEDFERDVLDGDVQSIKKVSSSKFILTLKNSEKATCQAELDLSKSSEFQEHSCKDSSGVVVSESKLISVRPIKVQDYVSTLKEIKLEVVPHALDCVAESEESEESTCFGSVVDEEKRDWSYLLK